MSVRLTQHCFSFAELGLLRHQAGRQLFTRLQAQPWAMLLESASDTHPDSRFDIICADPLATVVTQGETTWITDASTANTTSSSDADPTAATDL